MSEILRFALWCRIVAHATLPFTMHTHTHTHTQRVSSCFVSCRCMISKWARCDCVCVCVHGSSGKRKTGIFFRTRRANPVLSGSVSRAWIVCGDRDHLSLWSLWLKGPEDSFDSLLHRLCVCVRERDRVSPICPFLFVLVVCMCMPQSIKSSQAASQVQPSERSAAAASIVTVDRLYSTSLR